MRMSKGITGHPAAFWCEYNYGIHLMLLVILKEAKLKFDVKDSKRLGYGLPQRPSEYLEVI